MEKNKIRYWLHIASASFLFLAFGIWEIISPKSFVGYLPSFLLTENATTFVIIHGMVLTALGIWIITGKWLKAASAVGALMILQIIFDLIVSSGFTDLLVRDIALLMFVLSLAFEEKAASN